MADSLRPDGSLKGQGFLGPLPRRNSGMVSTEISVGTGDVNGQEMDIPTLVPGLTSEELNLLLSKELSPREIPDSIMDKAIKHARKRIAGWRSPFAENDEKTSEFSPLRRMPSSPVDVSVSMMRRMKEIKRKLSR